MKVENLALWSMIEHQVFNTRNIIRNNIRFYDEIYNLYKTWSENIEHYLASTRIPYYNTYLQSIEDQYTNFDKSVLHQRDLELQQEISDIEELLLPNEQEALENAIQQNKELLSVPRSKSSLEQRIQKQNKYTKIEELEFQKAKKLKVDLTTNHVNKIDKSLSVPNSPSVIITYIQWLNIYYLLFKYFILPYIVYLIFYN